MEESALMVRNLCRKQGKFKLHDISFTLPKGYIMGLVGRMGAGKTTLLKSILNPSLIGSGSVEYEGQAGFIMEDAPFFAEATLKENMDVFLFEKIVAQMDFAIASRFHSIVHAYKNAVPCIALGWATKYHELLNLVDQGEYVLDVRNMDKNDAYYREMIERMNNNFKNESELIRNKVEGIQSHNCFDRIDF